MLLSVVVYKHRLTPGQWLGAGVVFAGIAVEAGVKRKGSCRATLHVSADLAPQKSTPSVSSRKRKRLV
jgi:hypothetical protein